MINLLKFGAQIYGFFLNLQSFCLLKCFLELNIILMSSQKQK